MAAARRAGAEWRGWSVDRRCDALVRVADAIVARADDLALLESLDCGKPRQLARVVDVARAEENFRFFASFVRHEAGATPAHLSDGVINYEERSPHGVCALITPWNLPLYLLTWKVAPALAMGNTVVAKPSEWSPLTALALGEIVAEAGIPPGVFNVVHGRGACAGDALVRHPSVKMVSFTGGTVTGRIVGGHCGRLFKVRARAGGRVHVCCSRCQSARMLRRRGRAHVLARAHSISSPLPLSLFPSRSLPRRLPHPPCAMQRCSLELGGKNAAVVMADADTDLVGRELARAAFLNNGQICLCCERVLVQRAVYDKVRGALVDAARELVVGDPEDSRTQCGPLIHPNQVEKVRRMLQEAADDGATLLCGGGTPAGLPERCQRGCFVAPCVLEGAKQDDRITQNETFGPMTSLQAFDTEEEAIALANGTNYGLAASVFAGDSGAAQRIARAIDAGTVWVNCWLQRDLRVAFGGMKDSGLGREGGHHSLDAFSERRTIVTKH